MKLLPLVKIWTGDGLGQSAAVTLTQLKRTELGAPYPAALYSRTQKNGTPHGCEVFIVNVVEGGTPLPGGGVIEESYEQYPTGKRFGKIAWHTGLKSAVAIYDNLVKGIRPCDVYDEDEDNDSETDVDDLPSVPVVHVTRERKPAPQLNLPTGEFSTIELAKFNGVDYSIAFLFLKDVVETKTVSFVREERRNVKGKKTKLYAKV